ncbi:glycosyltransferase [Zobellella maritima]|uniref:glycosyltransferase n=1 Tax=Zobellella maritima TaxID=2059725 RepID=UPI000E307B8A|nr:glycosyltransferase [Zobellella maritima]
MKYVANIDLSNKNNSHTLAYDFVDKVSAGRSLHILEVGCSSGYLGAALREAGHQVFGVEPCHEAAQVAAKVLDNVFEGCVQDFFSENPELKFDVVIFGDVLEHIADPNDVLELTRNYLTTSGVIVASVPNVAHICMRAMLLEGRWDYTDLGIMDRTHLRFFTKKTLINLFTESAYQVSDIVSTTLTPDNFETMFGENLDKDILRLLQLFVKNSESLDFQYVCLATPAENIAEAKVSNEERFGERLEVEQIYGISEAIRTFENKIIDQENKIEALNNLNKELCESVSWRITAPLRNIKSFSKRYVEKWRKMISFIYRFCQSEGGMDRVIRKAFNLYRRDGIKGLFRKFRLFLYHIQAEKFERNDYAEWVRRFDSIDKDARDSISSRINMMQEPPLISVVMPTYNPKPQWLKDAIESVQKQLYPHWELCIADDASTDPEVRSLLEKFALDDVRIKVVFRNENGHISAASNSALELATGDWIALMDHDDLLPEHALYYVADTIIRNPDAGVIYSDEDKVDEAGNRFSPHFKSDWNPELFFSQNYVSHLGVYKHTILKNIGGFRTGLEGSQDYDLLLRCLPYLNDEQIIHIPRVLYHWRVAEGSTALCSGEKSYTTEAGIKALRDYFVSQSKTVTVESGVVPNTYRVNYSVPYPEPLVSLIIPTRDCRDITETCVRSILTKSSYVNFEILILDNGSVESDTLDFFESIQKEDARVKVIRYDYPFNYSAINNFGVKHSKGEIIGLVNNDIEVISPEWLSEMVSHAIRPEIGCVGAKLYYSNDTLQHAGVILGVGGVAGHSHKYYEKSEVGYFSRLLLSQAVSAVTAACLLVRREVFEQVGGLDEVNLKVAFNDVDFCLKVREAGYRNVWATYAELYHHESISRGAEDTPEKIKRFNFETQFMKNKWGALLKNDPYYNPNLTIDHEDFSLAWSPRIL